MYNKLVSEDAKSDLQNLAKAIIDTKRKIADAQKRLPYFEKMKEKADRNSWFKSLRDKRNTFIAKSNMDPKKKEDYIKLEDELVANIDKLKRLESQVDDRVTEAGAYGEDLGFLRSNLQKVKDKAKGFAGSWDELKEKIKGADKTAWTGIISAGAMVSFIFMYANENIEEDDERKKFFMVAIATTLAILGSKVAINRMVEKANGLSDQQKSVAKLGAEIVSLFIIFLTIALASKALGISSIQSAVKNSITLLKDNKKYTALLTGAIVVHLSMVALKLVAVGVKK